MHFQRIVLCCFSTLYDESIDVFHCGDFPLSRKLGEIYKFVLVGQWQLTIQPDIEFCISNSAALASNQTDLSSPQQSWMPSQSADHQLMLPGMLVELSSRLPMLARHLVWTSAE